MAVVVVVETLSEHNSRSTPKKAAYTAMSSSRGNSLRQPWLQKAEALHDKQKPTTSPRPSKPSRLNQRPEAGRIEPKARKDSLRIPIVFSVTLRV